jgi:homoserine kinase
MPRSRSSHSEIVVPGSIGNLGPGFDTLSLAVSLYLRARVTRIVDDGRGALTCRFAGPPPRGQNRILRAFESLPQRTRRPASVDVEVASDIPQGAGLGSSAAATIAGFRLRELVDGRRPHAELLACARRLERHPDNVAAALTGGLTTSWVRADRSVGVIGLRWPSAWRIVVATPDVQLSTAASRRALPSQVPLADAVFNLQRVSLLLAAVREQRTDLLAEAFADRLHQPYRQPLVPLLQRMLRLQHPDLLGVCLSGAGPSTAAFAIGNLDGIGRAIRRVYQSAGVSCTIRILRAHQVPQADDGERASGKVRGAKPLG